MSRRRRRKSRISAELKNQRQLERKFKRTSLRCDVDKNKFICDQLAGGNNKDPVDVMMWPEGVMKCPEFCAQPSEFDLPADIRARVICEHLRDKCEKQGSVTAGNYIYV
jgi:hypothetical protein